MTLLKNISNDALSYFYQTNVKNNPNFLAEEGMNDMIQEEVDMFLQGVGK